MKQLIKLIIVYIIVLFVLAETAIILESDKRNISNLSAQNATLQQKVSELQSTVDKLTGENAQLKAQQTKPPETQKTSRSADRPRYNLTETERDLIERVVMAESGGESYKGQMLVAQCILNACEIDGIRPAKAVKKYAYAKARPKPTDSVKRAVSAVFDKGEQVTDEKVIYFYAPGIVKSEFHESQIFAIEEGGHRFFAER
jgi:spore germination cell wall hydrolase CwlJ-like protein